MTESPATNLNKKICSDFVFFLYYFIVGYTPVGSVKYPDNIGHRILNKVKGKEDDNKLMLLMYSKQLLKVESSKNEKNGTTHTLTNDKNAQNIGTSSIGNGVTINHARIEKDDFDGCFEKDEPESNVPADGLNQMKNKQNMSLPPHWREIQPNSMENNRDFNDDEDDDDDDDNNKNRITISSDQTTTTSITDFSKYANKSVDLNADSIVSDTAGAKKIVPRTYVISENLDEDYEHLELD